MLPSGYATRDMRLPQSPLTRHHSQFSLPRIQSNLAEGGAQSDMLPDAMSDGAGVERG